MTREKISDEKLTIRDTCPKCGSEMPVRNTGAVAGPFSQSHACESGSMRV